MAKRSPPQRSARPARNGGASSSSAANFGGQAVTPPPSSDPCMPSGSPVSPSKAGGIKKNKRRKQVSNREERREKPKPDPAKGKGKEILARESSESNDELTFKGPDEASSSSSNVDNRHEAESTQRIKNGETLAPQLSPAERVKLLQIAYRHRAKLLDCPKPLADDEFSKLVADQFSATVRPGVFLSTLGVRTTVNKVCGDHLYRRTESHLGPNCRQPVDLRRWIDKWVCVWRARNLIVNIKELVDSVQLTIGRGRLRQMFQERLENGDLPEQIGPLVLSPPVWKAYGKHIDRVKAGRPRRRASSSTEFDSDLGESESSEEHDAGSAGGSTPIQSIEEARDVGKGSRRDDYQSSRSSSAVEEAEVRGPSPATQQKLLALERAYTRKLLEKDRKVHESKSQMHSSPSAEGSSVRTLSDMMRIPAEQPVVQGESGQLATETRERVPVSPRTINLTADTRSVQKKRKKATAGEQSTMQRETPGLLREFNNQQARKREKAQAPLRVPYRSTPALHHIRPPRSNTQVCKGEIKPNGFYGHNALGESGVRRLPLPEPVADSITSDNEESDDPFPSPDKLPMGETVRPHASRQQSLGKGYPMQFGSGKRKRHESFGSQTGPGTAEDLFVSPPKPDTINHRPPKKHRGTPRHTMVAASTGWYHRQAQGRGGGSSIGSEFHEKTYHNGPGDTPITPVRTQRWKGAQNRRISHLATPAHQTAHPSTSPASSSMFVPPGSGGAPPESPLPQKPRDSERRRKYGYQQSQQVGSADRGRLSRLTTVDTPGYRESSMEARVERRMERKMGRMMNELQHNMMRHLNRPSNQGKLGAK